MNHARATRLDGDVKAYTGKPAMAPSRHRWTAQGTVRPPELTRRAAADLARPVQRTAGNRQRGVAVQPLVDQLLLPPLVKRMEYAGGRHCPSDSKRPTMPCASICYRIWIKITKINNNAAEIQSWVINDLGKQRQRIGSAGALAVLTISKRCLTAAGWCIHRKEKNEALIRRGAGIPRRSANQYRKVSMRGRWRQWRATKRRRSSRWHAPSARCGNGVCV